MASLTLPTAHAPVFRLPCVWCNQYRIVEAHVYDQFAPYLHDEAMAVEDEDDRTFLASDDDEATNPNAWYQPSTKTENHLPVHEPFTCCTAGLRCDDEASMRAVLAARNVPLDVASIATTFQGNGEPFPNKVADKDINPKLKQELEGLGAIRCTCCGDWRDGIDELDEETSTVCDDGCSGNQQHHDEQMRIRIEGYYEADENYTQCLGCQNWTHCDHVNLDDEDYCEQCELPAPSPSGWVNGTFQRGEKEATGVTAICPLRHRLVSFLTPNASFTCDGCEERQPVGAAMSGCQACEYDLCKDCD